MDYENFISTSTGLKLAYKDSTLQSQNSEVIQIVKKIPRFVETEGYTAAFGRQWKIYNNVQLDSKNGTSRSEERLRVALGKPLGCIKGLKVLEAGSGAGRFTEILLKYGAKVYSFDLSNAVEVNYKNNSTDKNLTIFQADIENIPFEDNFFDLSICLGVMQHTRDSKKSLKELARVTKKNGVISFDHYRKHPGQYFSLYLVYWYIIKNLHHSKQHKITESLTKLFFPIHWLFRKSVFIQFILRRISPISFYFGMFKLTKEQHFNLSLLDTHDKNTDYYKRMITNKQLNKMVQKFNFHSFRVFKGGTGLQCIIIK
jgi:ubiquinone/menaquinone biosynthesis C-methylase UbiE